MSTFGVVASSSESQDVVLASKNQIASLENILYVDILENKAITEEQKAKYLTTPISENENANFSKVLKALLDNKLTWAKVKATYPAPVQSKFAAYVFNILENKKAALAINLAKLDEETERLERIELRIEKRELKIEKRELEADELRSEIEALKIRMDELNQEVNGHEETIANSRNMLIGYVIANADSIVYTTPSEIQPSIETANTRSAP